MYKNAGITRRPVSIYFRDETIAAIDKTIEKINANEPFGRFSRSNFVEKSVIKEIQAYDLLEAEQETS